MEAEPRGRQKEVLCVFIFENKSQSKRQVHPRILLTSEGSQLLQDSRTRRESCFRRVDTWTSVCLASGSKKVPESLVRSPCWMGRESYKWGPPVSWGSPSLPTWTSSFVSSCFSCSWGYFLPSISCPWRAQAYSGFVSTSSHLILSQPRTWALWGLRFVLVSTETNPNPACAEHLHTFCALLYLRAKFQMGAAMHICIHHPGCNSPRKTSSCPNFFQSFFTFWKNSILRGSTKSQVGS